MSWWHNPPTSLEDIMELLERRVHMLKSEGEEGQQLRQLLQNARISFQSNLKDVQSEWPIAFFQPSYEQSLMLNAWIWGIDFPICFAANRIGKTVAFVINALLWIYPNDPSWRMFQPYVDEYGQLIRVLPRPPLQNLRKLQEVFSENPVLYGDPYYPFYDVATLPPNARIHPERDNHNQILAPTPEHQPNRQSKSQANQKRFAMLQKYVKHLYNQAYPSPPLNKSGVLWAGAQTADSFKNTIMKRWRDWLPRPTIEEDSTAKNLFRINTKSDTNPTPTKWEIHGKSYESKATVWASDAVHGIILSEGFTSDILNEVKNRFAEPAFGSWDYTPDEARNVGPRTALAYRVFKGEEELPLFPFIFRKFSVRNAPEHVVPRKKRLDMIRMWGGKPEGQARLEGDFYASSGLILEHLNREIHCLDWTIEELFQKRPRHQLYRGIDPGLDHPTVCWWALLDHTNTWFFYRCYRKRGATIPQRCKDIIELSKNEQKKWVYGQGPQDYLIQEAHTRPNSEVYAATIADYKMFKTDETTGQNLSLIYARNGLNLIESVHLGPEDRALEANSLLDPNNHKYHPHPVTNVAPSPKIFFLTKGYGVAEALTAFDNLFWDRYRSGDYVGQPKDKVPVHGDDELDALCNIVCGPFRYTGYTPHRNLAASPEHYEEVLMQQPQSA